MNICKCDLEGILWVLRQFFYGHFVYIHTYFNINALAAGIIAFTYNNLVIVQLKTNYG
jgi:hypothetical protein